MFPILRCELLLIALGGCGLLPPDDPQTPKPAVDQDVAQLVHPWKVTAHVLGMKTNLSERDATELHGRAVTIGAASYTTPWHGTCEEANREKRKRELAKITAELDLSKTSDAAVRTFGLVDPVVESRLACKGRAPALTIFVGAGRAMTCFGGACYLLAR